MLILDTELDNRSESPPASQRLQGWAARLWSWLRRQPEPENERAASADEQDCGAGLIL